MKSPKYMFDTNLGQDLTEIPPNICLTQILAKISRKIPEIPPKYMFNTFLAKISRKIPEIPKIYMFNTFLDRDIKKTFVQYSSCCFQYKYHFDKNYT